MPKDLTVTLPDESGKLAELGEATASAGINIEGLCATTAEGRGVVHVLVEDPGAARDALSKVGIEVTEEREVIVVELENRPGAMAKTARRLAEAKVNIEFAYTTFGGIKLVVGVDELEKAQAAI